jgi:hypothetical protein
MSILVFEQKTSSSSKVNHRLEKREFGLKPRFLSETTNGNGGECAGVSLFSGENKTLKLHINIAV